MTIQKTTYVFYQQPSAFKLGNSRELWRFVQTLNDLKKSPKKN